MSGFGACTCGQRAFAGQGTMEVGGVLHRKLAPCVTIDGTQASPQPVDDAELDAEETRWKLIGQGLLPNPNMCAKWVGLHSMQRDPRLEPMQRIIDGFAEDLMRSRINYDGLLEQNNKWAEAAQRRRRLIEWLRDNVTGVHDQIMQEMFDYALEEEL